MAGLLVTQLCVNKEKQATRAGGAVEDGVQ